MYSSAGEGLRSPARLVVAVGVFGEAAQVGAIGAQQVEFAAVVVVRMVEVGGEDDPAAIGRETGALAVAARWGELPLPRAIGIHQEEFALPGFARVGDDLPERGPVAAATQGGQVADRMQVRAVEIHDPKLIGAAAVRGEEDPGSVGRPGGVPACDVGQAVGTGAVAGHDPELVAVRGGDPMGEDDLRPVGGDLGGVDHAQAVGQRTDGAIRQGHLVDLVDARLAEGGVDQAEAVGREGRVIVLARVVGGEAAVARAVGVDDTDLVGGLHLEDLAGEDDMAVRLVILGDRRGRGGAHLGRGGGQGRHQVGGGRSGRQIASQEQD